ncbi:AraC family transcriptional regulator [Paenibacillus hamazuiensis]|uniref:AraC family transcriptional regulator n=1 Tax=Paenibacillus hamazuiensis TaxID=2936508 RepID=UPI00200C2C22|nr:AraC family transcriptional regulator [Paenibacillus hamazuiensis]
MTDTSERIIDSYISDLQVQILNAGYTKCKRSWGCKNITPKYNKLYYICGGEGWIRIGDTTYEPKPGQLFFIPAGTQHSFSAVSDNTFTKYWCHFTSNVVFEPLFKYYRLPYFIGAAGENEVERAFAKLTGGLCEDAPSVTLRVKAAIFEIVSYYINRSVSPEMKKAAPPSIRKLNALIQYIDSRLNEDIKIEDLAEVIHYHHNYVIKYFKSLLGMTPMQFIYNRRLEKAKNLLTHTDIALSEVAVTTGFSDLCHFSKSFKKHLGVTPKQFRDRRAKQPS